MHYYCYKRQLPENSGFSAPNGQINFKLTPTLYCMSPSTRFHFGTATHKDGVPEFLLPEPIFSPAGFR